MDFQKLKEFNKVELDQFVSKSTFDTSDGYFWEFRFKGYKENVNALKKYCEENGIRVVKEIMVEDEYKELRVISEYKTMDLIEMFPELEATGWIEMRGPFGYYCVYTLYSLSGYNTFTHKEFAGDVDPNAEGGDARWDLEYDMMKNIKVKFENFDNPDVVHKVDYSYPYSEMWNKNSFILKYNEVFYIKNKS